MPLKKNLKDKVDKRRRAKLVVGHDMEGNPIIKYASGMTKKELEESKEEIRRTYQNGSEAIRRAVTFSEYALEWLSVYKLPGLSKSSRDNYQNAYHKHLMKPFGNKQMRAIRTVDIDRCLNNLGHYSKTTVNYIRTILKNVFARAYAEGVIDRDPATRLKNTGKKPKERRALTESETNAVLRIIKSDRGNAGRLLALLYYTGIRRGEALGLQWRDVDFSERVVHIRRDVDFKTHALDTLKTDSSLRDVPLPAALFQYLHPLRGIGETHIVLSPRTKSFLQQSTFVRLWEQIQADIPALCGGDARDPANMPRSVLTPHYFRHNYATLLYDAGIDVLTAKRYLGHSDVKTTLSIYAHLSEEKAKRGGEKVDAAFQAREQGV
jgi:integrase